MKYKTNNQEGNSQRFIRGEFVLVPSIKHLSGIPCSAQVVYMWLAYHSDYSTGECYPSYSTLEVETGLSKPTLIRAVKTLIKKGLIKRIKRKKKNSKENTSNRYILLNLGSKEILPPSKIILPPSITVLPELKSLNYKRNSFSKNNNSNPAKVFIENPADDEDYIPDPI